MSTIDVVDKKAPLSGKLLRDDDIIFASSGAKAPFVEVAPVRHGHWIPVHFCVGKYSDEFECSACKCITQHHHCVIEMEYDYCPRCGAKMDGKE